jgi:TolA-binding protein
MNVASPYISKKTGCRCAGLIAAVLATAALPAIAAPPPPNAPQTLSTAEVYQRLATSYYIVRTWFWKSENGLRAEAFDETQDWSRAERLAFFAAPLEKSDLLYPGYKKAAIAADKYIALADQYQLQPDGLARMIYLSAVAHLSCGEYDQALKLFVRLNHDDPDFKREQYRGDSYPPDPSASIMVQASVAKLIFVLKLWSLPKNPRDPWATLQQVTHDALAALSAQQPSTPWGASLSTTGSPPTFDESRFGGEPDQLRASALPSTLLLVEQAWEYLIPRALAQAGAVQLRQFLQSCSQPDSPLEKIGIRYRSGLDAKIIAGYFAEAQRLVAAHNFDGARQKYSQISREYAGTEAATRAEAALPGIKTQAVAWYQSEGTKSFQPVNKPGVAQSKSRVAFANLLKEDPNSDVGAYYLARSLATENKFDQALAYLRDFEKKHPNSPLRSAALFQQGFLLASRKKPDYTQAVQIMDRVAKEYPSSKEAPEALFYAGTYLAWQSRFPEAIAHLSQIEKYPKSGRSKWSKTFIAYLQQKVKDGTKWP